MLIPIFHLPTDPAGMTTPSAEATLRRPLTRNSRPISSTAIQSGTRSSRTRGSRAAVTSSLSATGSRSLPKTVTWPRLRARYPSSQSVAEASRKITSAIQRSAVPSRTRTPGAAGSG